MGKLNQLATALSGLLVLAAVYSYSTTGLAANYKRQNRPPQIATPPGYKGNAAAGNSKGEAPQQPAPADKPRPAMVAIILKDGSYVGIGAGYDSYKVNQFSQFTGATDTIFNPTINATGLVGTLLAGYGRYFNNALYLGLEVFGNISEAYQSTNVSIANSTDTITCNAKFFATMGYGANLLPGIKLSDSAMVFLRLGFQVARLRGQENLIDNGAFIISNTSSWSGGFTYGLGFEEAMVGNLSLRGEYAHTDYRSFTATSGTQYSPSNNQFLLSLLYHFT